jgi:hypothetical protein
MPETKAKRRPAAKKAATARNPRAATRKPQASGGKRDKESTVQRSTELSEDVLKSLDDGARAAIDSVRKFVATVDRELPSRGGSPSRERITDSALEMAQRLVHTQAEFLRKVVDSAGKSLSRADGAK